MFCTNCGNEIEEDSIYCIHCGYKTITENSEDDILKDTNVMENDEDDILKDTNVTENDEDDILRDINIPEISRMLCMILLTIGLIASLVNTVSFYIDNKDITYIFGQMIFVSIFIISIFLLWKSKKIGGSILILFVLFKMICSIYYYVTIREYTTNNLIYDEIFYFIIALLLIISWKTLK